MKASVKRIFTWFGLCRQIDEAVVRTGDNQNKSPGLRESYINNAKDYFRIFREVSNGRSYSFPHPWSEHDAEKYLAMIKWNLLEAGASISDLGTSKEEIVAMRRQGKLKTCQSIAKCIRPTLGKEHFERLFEEMTGTGESWRRVHNAIDNVMRLSRYMREEGLSYEEVGITREEIGQYLLCEYTVPENLSL